MCVTRHTPSELQPILTLSEGSCMWNDYQKCMMSTRLSVDWLLNQRHKVDQGGLLCFTYHVAATAKSAQINQ